MTSQQLFNDIYLDVFNEWKKYNEQLFPIFLD